MHRVVSDKPIDFEDIDISTLDFIAKSVGENWVTLENNNIPNAISKKRSWLLTFDDGYLSDYQVVYPLLQSHGIMATFFLITNNVGEQGYVDWSHVREMHKAGMVFGSHSMNHLKMTTLTIKEAKDELIGSRKCLEDQLGEAVNLFSFPYGYYNRRLISLALECGYKTCFVSNHGAVQLPSTIIPRNSINGAMSSSSINKTLQASLLTRICWGMEDAVKNTSKNLVGDKFYKNLRRYVSSE